MATLALTGTALLGTTLYAASTEAAAKNSTTSSSHKMHRWDISDLRSSLSGTVSPEALSALDTLMQKHATEMRSLQWSGANTDKATLEAKHAAFKAEMDALIVKYPELKTALQNPQMNKMGRWKGNNEIDTLLESISDTDKAAIEAIRTEYRTRQDALHTEEKSKIDTILTKYPEVKAKLDTLESSRPKHDDKKSGRGGSHGQR